MNNWIDGFLGGKINREAEISQGTDAQDHFERKVKSSSWLESVSELDPVKVEKEYQDNLAAEAKLLGKTAAYEAGDSVEETLKKDYARDVSILSDYALAEMVAGIRGHAEQNTSETFHEKKEEAKKNVASNRKKVEEEVLKATGMSAQVDWKKEFARYSKEAKPEEAKDLYQPIAPEKEHEFQKPTEDKFKVPKDQEKAIPGNGREVSERQDATKQAGVLQADITEGLGKVASVKKEARPCNANDIFLSSAGGGMECGNCGAHGDHATLKHDPTLNPQLSQSKVADKVKDNPADDKGNLALPEGKKSAGDKPVEAVEESTLLPSPKEVGDKSDQAAEANSPEKGDKAKSDEAVNKKADVYQPKTGEPCSCKPGIARDNCPSCEGTGQKVDFKKIRETNKEAAASPSGLKNKLVEMGYSEESANIIVGQWQAGQHPGTEPKTKQDVERALSELSKEAHCGSCPGDPGVKTATCEGCPVCGGEGRDLANGQKDHMSCMGCGINYGHKEGSCGHCGSLNTEIEARATKEDVLKIIKEAEVSSPWKIIKDESGQDVIARVAPELSKESEEKKEEEIQK